MTPTNKTQQIKTYPQKWNLNIQMVAWHTMTSETKLDSIDAWITDYIKDLYGSVSQQIDRRIIDRKLFVLVDHTTVAMAMPYLKIKDRSSISVRIQKLCDENILESRKIGRQTFVRPLPVVDKLYANNYQFSQSVVETTNQTNQTVDGLAAKRQSVVETTNYLAQSVVETTPLFLPPSSVKVKVNSSGSEDWKNFEIPEIFYDLFGMKYNMDRMDIAMAKALFITSPRYELTPPIHPLNTFKNWLINEGGDKQTRNYKESKRKEVIDFITDGQKEMATKVKASKTAKIDEISNKINASKESVSKMYYEKPPVESSTSYEPVTNSEVVEITQAEDESEADFEARVREAKAQGKEVKTYLNLVTQTKNKKKMAEMIRQTLRGKTINGNPEFRDLQTPSDFMREATRPVKTQNNTGFQRMGSKPTEEEIKAEMERNRNALLNNPQQIRPINVNIPEQATNTLYEV